MNIFPTLRASALLGERHVPMPYRSELDGLRACAVLAIILSQFGVPYMSASGAGWDMLFVITGFLLGSSLWRERDRAGRIDLLGFLMRRIRRRVPAFLVMIGVTTALALLLFLPDDLRDFGRELVASLLFFENIQAFRSGLSFDVAGAAHPLLHSWSLALGAQVCVVLLLLLAWPGHSRSAVWILVVLWFLSLGAAILIAPLNNAMAFYLLPFRAWEFLTGVLLAVWGLASQRRWTGSFFLSSLGLLLVGVAVFLGPDSMDDTGFFALLPVLGTVLLIANGAGANVVNRVLSHRLAVGVGQLSYGLYLWHWPLLTFAWVLRGPDLTSVEMAILGATLVMTSWLSWRYLETPRPGPRALSGPLWMSAALTVVSAGVFVGAWFIASNGAPARFGPEVHTHLRATKDVPHGFSRCAVAEAGPLAGLNVCRIGPDGPPRVLVWGDSHAEALHQTLSDLADESEVPGLLIARPGCPPLLGLRKVEQMSTHAKDIACTHANLQIMQSFVRFEALEKVMLVGRWTYYANGTGVGLDAADTIALRPVEGPIPANPNQANLLAQASAQSVNHLINWFDEVFVLRQPPEMPAYHATRAAQEAAHKGLPLAAPGHIRTSVARDAFAARHGQADVAWRPLSEAGAITWLDPWPLLCDDQACHAVHEGVARYHDTTHLTLSGASEIRTLLSPLFRSDVQKTAQQ